MTLCKELVKTSIFKILIFSINLFTISKLQDAAMRSLHTTARSWKWQFDETTHFHSLLRHLWMALPVHADLKSNFQIKRYPVKLSYKVMFVFTASHQNTHCASLILDTATGCIPFSIKAHFKHFWKLVVIIKQWFCYFPVPQRACMHNTKTKKLKQLIGTQPANLYFFFLY